VIVACFAYVLASDAFDSWIALPCDLPARRLAPARCSNDGLETIPLSVNLVKLTVASRDVPVIPIFSGFYIVWKRGGACSRPSLGNTWIVEDEITEFAGLIDCIVGTKEWVALHPEISKCLPQTTVANKDRYGALALWNDRWRSSRRQHVTSMKPLNAASAARP
jgi:hypothetical protein